MFNTVELGSDITVLLGDDQQSNSVVINYGESQIVVDTLCGERDVARLAEIVCCQQAPLRYIVNTHWHSDHIGGNGTLKELFPESTIVAHESYWDTIIAEEGLITQHDIPDPASYPTPRITVDEHYEIVPDLMMLNVGGHTKDSCIVHIPSKSLVLCGDVVLSANAMGGVSIPYFYWGDPNDLLRALNKIRELEPRILIPGHGWIVKSDILDNHILYLEKLLKAYKEYRSSCSKAVLDTDLPGELALESIMDCTKGVHWTFRKMHKCNLQRLEQLLTLKKQV